MIDHEAKIIDTLKTIPGLGWISDGWPDVKTKMPCIVVGLASDQAKDRRDDRAYLVELEYYVRIFDTTKPRMQMILEEVDARMAGIGYERTFRYEQNEKGSKQWVLRYRTCVGAKE